jgi:16S rRNA (guanine(966)-N(2))-methyltransferase RsmD
VDFDSSPRALDLFGGTGAIGLEFVSRGCSEVVSVEKDFKHWQYLQRIAKELGDPAWKPVHADVFKYLQRVQTPFNIIFADPPYALQNLGEIPNIVFSTPLLVEGGTFILEHGKDHDFSDHPRFQSHRNYGSVNFSFFQ